MLNTSGVQIEKALHSSFPKLEKFREALENNEYLM